MIRKILDLAKMRSNRPKNVIARGLIAQELCKHFTQEDVADFLKCSRSCISYSINNIDKYGFSYEQSFLFTKKIVDENAKELKSMLMNEIYVA